MPSLRFKTSAALVQCSRQYKMYADYRSCTNKEGVARLARSAATITSMILSNQGTEVFTYYRYQSPKMPAWRNMRIELQIRSMFQHTWATAVEAASFVTGQDLKSSQGDEKWLRFFVLMANWIAMLEESTLIRGTSGAASHLLQEIQELSVELNVQGALEGAAAARSLLPKHAGKHAQYKLFLLLLDSEKRLKVWGFREGEAAADSYAKLEDRHSDKHNKHLVLVKADSLKVVKRGYPGFLPTLNGSC